MDNTLRRYLAPCAQRHLRPGPIRRQDGASRTHRIPRMLYDLLFGNVGLVIFKSFQGLCLQFLRSLFCRSFPTVFPTSSGFGNNAFHVFDSWLRDP